MASKIGKEILSTSKWRKKIIYWKKNQRLIYRANYVSYDSIYASKLFIPFNKYVTFYSHSTT